MSATAGKTSELIALLADGRRRTVPEIHSHLGPCRLNSRAAEARRRLRVRVGRTLLCVHAPGVTGPAAYSYVIPGGPLTRRELSVLGTRSSRSVSDPLTRSEPEPKSRNGGSGVLHPRSSGSEPLCLIEAA